MAEPAPDVGEGWTVLTVERKGGKSPGHKDRYWFSPGGKKFRSKAEINRFKDALDSVGGGTDNEEEAWKRMKAAAKAKSTPTPKKKKSKSSEAAGSAAAAAETPGSVATSGGTPAADPDSGRKKKKEKQKTTKAKKKEPPVVAPPSPSAAAAGYRHIDSFFESSGTGSAKKKKSRPTPTTDDDGEEKKDDTEAAPPMPARKKKAAAKEAKTKKASTRKPAPKPPIEPEGSDTEMSDVEEEKEEEGSKETRKRKKADDAEEEESPPTASRRVRKNVNYNVDSLADWSSGASSSSEDEDFEKKPKKKKKGRAASTAGRRGKKKRAIVEEDDDDDDDDDDVSDEDLMSEESEDFEEDVVPSSEEEDDDDDLMDVDSDSEESDLEATKKRKGARASKASAKKAAGGKAKAKADPDADTESLEYLIEKESFKPKNNPQPFVEPFVEPVGLDPTDGIVEGIINSQVKKIGGILLRAMEAGDMAPLRLQTACSGTDAPSIALGLVKECLDRLQSDGVGDGDHAFKYEHVMSCEIEPFKQAYISRNFPETPLFPDICKLTEGDTVVDVYGRRTAIPEGNLFVAGTSCKDFSMLRTSTRLDIEDKGQSGETFLAAVEFLEKFQPEMAIFENVLNAPWAKMQEYITGRVNLATVYDNKNIPSPTKGAKELVFSANKKGQYVVEIVPRRVGIKAGSIVEGYIKGSDDGDGGVIPLVAQGNKQIKLAELVKKHKINLKTDVLVLEKNARYCTHLCKVDTKKYGLPQTRNRQYLFAWRSDDADDDLGEYYEEILRHLESPAIHAIDAFFLPPTHDRIRSLREALRSGPGLMVAREREKEPDFWDWEGTRCKDTPRHMRFRRDNGIADRSRWLTGWDTMCRKSLAPSLWPELFDMWNQRRLDLIDCFAAAAMRDAVPRDALHHSFTWDISQNVTRAPFRSGEVGVCGCVTPGGELVVPHLGRSLMGFEKLLLQGIPFSRLLLGNETEVQLSDLAGNAMSLPVVCATMLAAVSAKQFRREKESDRKFLWKNAGLSSKYESTGGAVIPQRGDLYGESRIDEEAGNAIESFAEIVDLAEDAFKSSVLCTCESSGRTTTADKLLECSGCGVVICQECCERHRTKSHDLKDICSSEEERVDPPEFERRLRSTVPAALRLGEGAESILCDGEGLESYSFQLQQVERKRGFWELIYGAKEDYGNGRQVAEIRVHLGRTGTLSDMGLCAYVRCFAPAIREENPHRGHLRDSARLEMFAGDGSRKTVWKIPASDSSSSLLVVGSNEGPSQRVQIGLNDEASKSIKNHKITKQFQPTIKSRNNLLRYEQNWKMWPGRIEISGDVSNRVNGTYERLPCEQTIVHSALWRRQKEGTSPTLYIYVRPDVNRAGLDVAVISPTPSYRDGAEIAELLDWIPENALIHKTHKTQSTFLEWKPAAGLRVEVAPTTLEVESPDTFVPEDSVLTPALCEIEGLPQASIQSLVGTSNEGAASVVTLDLSGTSVTTNTKRLSTVAAPVLLKHAAEKRLPLSLSNSEDAWCVLPATDKEFGTCQINVPLRPKEQWKEIASRKINVERVYDASESNDYYLKLLKRPKAWKVNIDSTLRKLSIHMNPYVAAHHAAAPLILGRHAEGGIDVKFRLSELSSMAEPNTEEFHVPNSDCYEETVVNGLEMPLYKRQAKALTRMLAIEKGEVLFSEEERSEHVLPGIGWCLVANASRQSPLRGGVLADAIGSGKTVVTIALILAGAEEARKSRDIKKGISSATLITVPPGLIQQWDDERKKFTEDKLKSIMIDSVDALKRYSVQDICEADIVIAPASILEERGKTGNDRPYTANLARMAKAKEHIPPAPTYYSQREAPTIEGTWVPNNAVGADPYVGNKGNQRYRDAQAYYTHCYSSAVSSLRQKEFSPSTTGVPLEYFTWKRVVIDECHETLVTAKNEEYSGDDFKDQARRGAREFLGVAQTDFRKRPLVAASVWGLTGTPLLETESRVTELANLMGGTYLTGAAHHWRKEERESGRDIFLNQQEGARSREYRCAVQAAAHAYVREACQRNRGSKLQVELIQEQACANMSAQDGDLFMKELNSSDSSAASRGFAVNMNDLADHQADTILKITACSKDRAKKLLETLESIQAKEPETKIIIFADLRHGGHAAAREALATSGVSFAFIGDEESVHRQNEIMSWFRNVDVTEEDRNRPRILLLSFEQAAGHNLQHACHHVIMYEPKYSGNDAVADASVEEQAIGRVLRQGQTQNVTVTRIVLKSPKGGRCADDWIVERNLDEKVLQAATSNFD